MGRPLRGGPLGLFRYLSHWLRLNAFALLQVICDVDGVRLLDRAGDRVDDAVLDPDHARPDAGVVPQGHALDSLHGHRPGRGVRDRYGDRQGGARVADRLDRSLEVRRDSWLGQDDVLHLLHRDLGGRRGRGGGLADDELRHADVARARTLLQVAEYLAHGGPDGHG